MTPKELKSKHDKLKKLDGGGLFRRASYKTFGSDTHRYRFNRCLSLQAIASFEKRHGVNLPSDYKAFLTTIGNGGSGPAYGLFPLEKWDFELGIDDSKFLSKDFPHTEAWNRPKGMRRDDYYSPEHLTGSMVICHYGCAIYYLLVLTGKEAGHIWVDDRASDYGIYPESSKSTGARMTFSEWYDEWLTSATGTFC